jgi:hypothetical protein
MGGTATIRQVKVKKGWKAIPPRRFSVFVKYNLREIF